MKTLSVNDSRMYSLIILYDMHTKYFKNALEGVSDTDAHNRLNTKANHIAWLTGSLVQQRFELGHALGLNLKQSAEELFRNNKGIQDGLTYPSLQTFLNDWEIISPVLREALITTSAQKLDASFGDVFINDGKGNLRWVGSEQSGLRVHGDVKDMAGLKINNENYLLFLRNNDYPSLYHIKN